MNVGCIPSKALLHSTHLYEHAQKDFSHHGISIKGTIEVDLKKMMDNKNKVVKGLTGGIEGLFKKNKVGLDAKTSIVALDSDLNAVSVLTTVSFLFIFF